MVVKIPDTNYYVQPQWEIDPGIREFVADGFQIAEVLSIAEFLSIAECIKTPPPYGWLITIQGKIWKLISITEDCVRDRVSSSIRSYAVLNVMVKGI